MKLKVGDNVRVITGNNKGKEGKVLEIFRKENKVLIDGVNIVKKHVKPNGQNETGGILEVEAPIHISNIKVLSKETKKDEKATKVKEEKETKEIKETKDKKTSKNKETKETKEKKASKTKEAKESK